MSGKQLRSVDHFEDAGKVEAGCGHKVDVRKLIYVHYIQNGHEISLQTCCPTCSTGLPGYVHPNDERKRE